MRCHWAVYYDDGRSRQYGFVGGDAYNIQIGYTVAICWFLIGIAMAIIGVCGAVLEAKIINKRKKGR